ncbi:protein SWOLLEN 1-like isoform X2 [Tasmannia lanceolata]|uniref:protein SWOLLEN 1-like isoform X2 n=1 Tax=Tasmannia lanceolata TaxID=3420 RepID=UPI004062F176
MDYDENDFQNQNFQLGGEDNTKFPLGLRSYALPKFDLDEHLQVHLWFNSLVETEALLGIQRQEDNHWIDGFSHGSSVIEFSSSAAESCSISRHNNVWSEATSSESVEMLLKSVGQDEMITKQTTIEGPDACDGLDTLSNQMDPSLSRDDSLPSMKGDVVGTNPTLPSEKCLKSLPGLSEDAAGDLAHVESMSQTPIVESSGDENRVGLGMSSDDGREVESGISVKGTEVDVDCGRDKPDTMVSVMDENETFKDVLAESSDIDVHNGPTFAVKVHAPADIILETRETIKMEIGDDNLGLREYTSMEKKMPGKISDNDTSNPDFASSVLGDDMPEQVHCTFDVNGEGVYISSSLDAGSLQTCDKSLSGIGSVDADIVLSDVPIIGNDNTGLSTTCPVNIETEIDGSLITGEKVEDSSHGQCIVTVTAQVHGSLSKQNLGGNSGLSFFNKLEDVHQILSGNSSDGYGVVVHEDVGTPPPPVSDFMQLDIKEEKITGISTETRSSVLKGTCKSHPVGGPLPGSVTMQQFGKSATELISETVAQSSEFTEKFAHSTCESEPRVSTPIKGTQELSEVLERHSTVPSPVKENDGSEVFEASSEKCEAKALHVTGGVAKDVEIPTLPVPSSVDESSHDIVQSKQQDGKSTLIAGDDSDERILVASTEGDAQNSYEENSLTLSKNIAESHAVQAGNGSPNDAEPNCGSPTVISCNELPQSEKEYEEGDNESLGKSILVSDDSPSIASDIEKQANNIKSTGHDPKENYTSEDDKSFTFEVGSSADQTEERTPKMSILCKNDPGMLQEASHGSHQMLNEEELNGGGKAGGEDKLVVMSGTVTEMVIAKEMIPSKETSVAKKTAEKDGDLCSTLDNSVETTNRAMQAEELPQYSGTKGCGVPAVKTSCLPDLNTSAPPTTLFHPHFTDLQQVQLRAQIFVYGSLIQGIAPDEACMVSAFGDASRDSGRSVWENVWRASVESFHNQKLPISNLETPLHSRSGVRVHEQVSRHDPLQGKTLGSPSGQKSVRGAPSTIVNSAMFLSSPLWSISTRDCTQSSSLPRGPFMNSRQSLSPLYPYQRPHARHYVGHSTPCLSQATCPPPWVVSPQTPTLNASARHSASSIAEAAQVASVRDMSAPRASNIVLSSPLAPIAGPMTVPTGTNLLMEPKRTAYQKPRKRKKSLATDNQGQIFSVSQPRTEPSSVTGVTKHLITSVGISSPAHHSSRAIPGGFVSTNSPIVPSGHLPIIGSVEANQRAIFSEEKGSRVEQAKLQAEDAASLAAGSVRHCQSIWTQLGIQKNSGLISDSEAKLACAAVAAAAATSVAKAAAAAAKVASDATLQAKLMADEALMMPRVRNFIPGSETVLDDGVKNLGRITPASILKGKENFNSSSSVIVAAREAARRRVEAASAAAKRAENLDAVVKAAELAAEAVAQVGTIIAMGDPICGVEQSIIDGANEGLDRSIQHIHDQSSNKKEKQPTADGGKTPQKENHAGLVSSMHLDFALSKKVLGVHKTRKASGVAKTIAVIPESDVGSRADLPVQNAECEIHQQAETSNVNCIKEGILVEVLSDEDGLRGVWFSAKVLSLRDGKALVCYNELLQDEGSDKLKEWIPLEGKGGNAPRIRIAHTMIAMKFEGTRKRQREARGNYVWSIGDRVDALNRNGWWEGIVTEKSKEDETKLTVQFTAGGDSSTVRAWDLRPSIIWKDDQWVEWSRESNFGHHEGDTPQEKRQKMGRSEIGTDIQVEAQAKDKLQKDPLREDLRKPDELLSRMLTAKDKIFNVGKNVRDQNKSDPLKVQRTGMHDERSSVIFGVPKPGKKRKFMEVSKQFVAERTGKISEATDSIKFAKYLIPRASRGLKNTLKVDFKGKRAADLKPKVLKSGKAQSVQSKTVSEKGGSSISIVTASSNGGSQDPSRKAKENNLEKNLLEETNGKLAYAGEETARDEEKGSSFNDYEGKPSPDAIERRRSNRRIQPTSRLLEGIQSSLTVAKISPHSHDKGAKARSRAAPS